MHDTPLQRSFLRIFVFECIYAVCHRAQRDYLAQKLEQVGEQLREAKADRKESERDRRMSEAVDQLKRFFPGECTQWLCEV
jgi:hypothetical protein